MLPLPTTISKSLRRSKLLYLYLIGYIDNTRSPLGALGNLPVEMRNAIYRYALTTDTTV